MADLCIPGNSWSLTYSGGSDAGAPINSSNSRNDYGRMAELFLLWQADTDRRKELRRGCMGEALEIGPTRQKPKREEGNAGVKLNHRAQGTLRGRRLLCAVDIMMNTWKDIAFDHIDLDKDQYRTVCVNGLCLNKEILIPLIVIQLTDVSFLCLCNQTLFGV